MVDCSYCEYLIPDISHHNECTCDFENMSEECAKELGCIDEWKEFWGIDNDKN